MSGDDVTRSVIINVTRFCFPTKRVQERVFAKQLIQQQVVLSSKHFFTSNAKQERDATFKAPPSSSNHGGYYQRSKCSPHDVFAIFFERKHVQFRAAVNTRSDKLLLRPSHRNNLVNYFRHQKNIYLFVFSTSLSLQEENAFRRYNG